MLWSALDTTSLVPIRKHSAGCKRKCSEFRRCTTRRQFPMTVLMGHASRSYGQLLSVMLEQEGSADVVLGKLMRRAGFNTPIASSLYGSWRSAYSTSSPPSIPTGIPPSITTLCRPPISMPKPPPIPNKTRQPGGSRNEE